MELWENCTVISRRCLVPAKSWWSLVDFTWKDGKWGCTMDMYYIAISIKDLEWSIVELVQLVEDKMQKNLGLWLAPGGKNNKHVVGMRTITVKWEEKVHTECMDQHNACQTLT